MELIWFVLAAYGLTQILVYGKIFSNYRPNKEDFKGWGEIFHCPMCMGFWVGVFLWGISPYTELFSFSNQPMTAFMCGCISAGTSYFLSMLVEDYGIRVVHKGGEKS